MAKELDLYIYLRVEAARFNAEGHYLSARVCSEAIEELTRLRAIVDAWILVIQEDWTGLEYTSEDAEPLRHAWTLTKLAKEKKDDRPRNGSSRENS